MLHGAPGSDCWSAMHSALKQAVQDAPETAPVVYAHRPYLSPACKVRTLLALLWLGSATGAFPPQLTFMEGLLLGWPNTPCASDCTHVFLVAGACTTALVVSCTPLLPTLRMLTRVCGRSLCRACTAQAVHPCSTLGSEEQLVLPGYGVEAVLKNMEYSAMDDKAKADAAAAAKTAAKAKAGTGGSDDISEIDVSSLGEVKGFKCDVLAQRKPHLVQELMTFRDVLMSNDEEEAIKVCLRHTISQGRRGDRGMAYIVLAMLCHSTCSRCSMSKGGVC